MLDVWLAKLKPLNQFYGPVVLAHYLLISILFSTGNFNLNPPHVLVENPLKQWIPITNLSIW